MFNIEFINILANSFSSIPNILFSNDDQFCQKEMVTTKSKIANKKPTKKVLNRKFLQKIILLFSIVFNLLVIK